VSELSLVAGVDVGGPAKGFHAVAISRRGVVAKTASRSAAVIASWCKEQGATVVAVDAPCRWRTGTQARLAEREMAQVRITSFSTPTEVRARGHAFFTWMFAGMEMFQALASNHPLYLGQANRSAVAIESFPQAVACALAGQIVSAKEKNRVRRALLAQAGIDETGLSNIDEVDATLCAIAAQTFVHGSFQSYGDITGGFIITPAWHRRDPFAPLHVRPAPPPMSRALGKIIAALPGLSPAERQILREHLAGLDDARHANRSGPSARL